MGTRCVRFADPDAEEEDWGQVAAAAASKPSHAAASDFPFGRLQGRGQAGQDEDSPQRRLSVGCVPAVSAKGLANVPWSPRMAAAVTLHIYDVGTSPEINILNRLLRPLGTGVFHCGVEVFGREWSYSDTTSGIGTGVFSCRPRLCEGHHYCESVRMGKSPTPEDEVEELLNMLSEHWLVVEYDTLTKNCCHFCNELCLRLGVGGIPKWVMNLAGAGAAIAATGDTTCCLQVAGQCCGTNRDDAAGVTLTSYKVVST
mmetsp:Transcript_22723/g.51981  ORF Transcript_22723/g.51981 Transcript_22723/m.51981 type:complete len:257 (+) Transcript_22723:67-837(+)